MITPFSHLPMKFVYRRRSLLVGHLVCSSLSGFTFFILSALTFLSLLAQAQSHRCASMDRHRYLMSTDPAYAASNPLSGQERVSTAFNDTDYITISVVVHVLYNEPGQNVSDEQIQSQIDVLNEDFSLLNPSAVDVPSIWEPIAADTRIRFALAKRDPAGNLTGGINRKLTYKSNFSQTDNDIFISDSGGYNPWPPSSYLNIWVCPLANNILGFANFPSSSGSLQDGVVLSYKAVGRRGTVVYPYDGGRTATHEVGHWLALLHIWGDDGGLCTGKDFTGTDQIFDDTPNQADANYRCRSFPQTDNCTPASPGIMFMNYMDYTDDACMSFFTKGQMKKMRAVLFNQRDSIRFSLGHVLPGLAASDASVDSVLFPVYFSEKRCFKPRIRIVNQGSDTLRRMTIDYGVAGGLKKRFVWEGELLPSEPLLLNLPLIGSGIGRQVMEFSVLESDDIFTNNFRSSGFVVNGGTEENCTSTAMTAYPNPLVEGHQVCIKTRFSNPQGFASIVLCNVLGEVIRTENRNVNPGDSFLIDLQGLPSGVYMVGVLSDEVSGAARVVYLPGSSTSAGSIPVCN